MTVYVVDGVCQVCRMLIRGCSTLSSCWCSWKCVHIGCPRQRLRNSVKCAGHA